MKFYNPFSLERRLNRNIDKVFSCLCVPRKELLVTKEMTYPQVVLYRALNYLNAYGLPVWKTIRINKVTQISCRGLEFRPTYL